MKVAKVRHVWCPAQDMELLRRGRKVMVNIKREISAPVVMKLVTCHLSL